MKGKGQGTFKRLVTATGEWEDVDFMDIKPLDIFRKYEDGMVVMGKDGSTEYTAKSVPFIDVLNGNEPTINSEGCGSYYLKAGEKVVRR